MSERETEEACCAHHTIVLDTIQNDDGTVSDSWTCRTCHERFNIRDLARLRAENERLRGEAESAYARGGRDESRGGAQAMAGLMDEIVAPLRAELEEARAAEVETRARLDAALRALRKYGQHHGLCVLNDPPFHHKPCDCGLAAALAEGEQRAVHEYIERKATAQDALRALGKAAPVVEESLGVAHELSVEIRAALAEGE